MPDHPKALMLPPAAEKDDQSTEMIRGWIADGGLHCVLNVGHWHKNADFDEPWAWGVMLADIAQHVANALEDATGLDRHESLLQLVQSFRDEIGAPTSEHRGMWPTEEEPRSEFREDR